jgi:cell division protein FtsN
MGHTVGAPAAPAPASDAADDAAAEADRAEAADTTASGEPAPGAEPERVYLQVSSSQNPEYARGLVRQLRQAGLDAGLLTPREDGDPYRVVVGPYQGRAQAEEASRRLNRPSFIVPAQPGDTLER